MHHPNVEDLEHHLRRIAVLIRHHTRELLSQYELTLPQYYALLALRNETLTMGELCCKLYLASSTVTDLIDRMEKLNLVRRVRDEKDRRVIRLEIIDAGTQVIKKVMQDRMRFLSEQLVQLDGEQVKQLVESLAELHELIAEKKDTK